jgi:hypothetical protein
VATSYIGGVKYLASLPNLAVEVFGYCEDAIIVFFFGDYQIAQYVDLG